MLDYTLVLRRPPCFDPGVGHECAVLRNACVFLITNRVFVECARRKVAVHFADDESVILESECSRIRHVRLWGVGQMHIVALARSSANRTKVLVSRQLALLLRSRLRGEPGRAVL